MELCNQRCQTRDVNNGICESKCVTASCEFDGEDCRQAKALPVYNGTNEDFIFDPWDGSMRHTSFILNKVLGPAARFMPAPGIFMLDKDILAEMGDRLAI